MAPTAHMEVGQDGVAVISLSNPPMNSLHPGVISALLECLKSAQADSRVKAIVLTGHKNFSAGFDIPTFVKIQSGAATLDDANPHFIALLEGGAKPSVAAIEGAALGGGLEVAMCCNARICSPASQLGLPELTLGIIPGFGGTQRLPRLVGLQKALQMMLTSKPIKAQEARMYGLVNKIVPASDLLAEAKAWALDIAEGRRPRVIALEKANGFVPWVMGSPNEVLPMLEMAKKQASKSGMQHPLGCIDAITVGVVHGPQAGLAKEQEVFQHCVQQEVSKSLVHIFLAKGATTKVRGVTDQGFKPTKLTTVAVLGGGLMGSGICTSLALAGCKVLLKEINQKFLDGGLERIKSNLMSSVKKKKMTEKKAMAVFGLVKGTLDYADFKECDMVIEAVIEDIPLKQQIFMDLEKSCPPHCILSTNTSTIDINVCAAKMQNPKRIVGAHFFSPAHIMPLLEIVRTPETPAQIVYDTICMAKLIKKTPVVVGNCCGFAVNRVFFPYTMTAIMLSDMGQDPYRIDQVINKGFGMPMGPFRLSDLVGGDIGLHVGKNFVDAFPDRVYGSTLIPRLNELKRLGEKTGRGFYQYDARRKAQPDPELGVVLEESRKLAKLPRPASLTDEDIIEMIFFPVVNEGCRVCDEGIVDKPGDLDIATVMSMGFPAHRGGLMHWADYKGAKYIVARLNEFAKMVPQAASFFAPSEYLQKCATAGVALSVGPSRSRL